MKKTIGRQTENPSEMHWIKKIGKQLVELSGFKTAGAMIRLWYEASPEDLDAEIKLPHTYTVSECGQYNLLDEVHFGHFENATKKYRQLKNGKDMLELAWENR